MPIVQTKLDEFLPGGDKYDPAKDPVERRLVGAGKGRFKDRPLKPCPPDAKALANVHKREAEMQVAILTFGRAAKAKGRPCEMWGIFDIHAAYSLACFTLRHEKTEGESKASMTARDFKRATEILNAEKG